MFQQRAAQRDQRDQRDQPVPPVPPVPSQPPAPSLRPSSMPSSDSLLLLLSGGGTGGHVYPALAVAAALEGQHEEPQPKQPKQPGQVAPGAAQLPIDGEASSEPLPPCQVVYVGSVGGMEQAIVQRESRLPFRALPTAALRGRGPLSLGRGIITMGVGMRAARRLLRELQPAAILGTGGYVCVPLFLAARLEKIPTIIYLPDVVPGLAVKLLARVATQVACNVEDARHYLPAASYAKRPLLVTGYPVRAALFQQEQAACQTAFGLDDALPVLLVYGGSRGARSVNRAVQALLPDILELAQVIHICGREGDEVWLQATAAQLDEQRRARYRLYPYLDEMGAQTMIRALGAADLALCRSGASTMAELPAAGLPAVLVPYPYVHQDENADYLTRHGAALKVADAAMLGDGAPRQGPLFLALQELLTDTQARERMAEQSRRLARPDAARRLAGALCNLATRSERT